MKMLFKCPCEAACLSALMGWSFSPFWSQAVPGCSEWLCLHRVLPLCKGQAALLELTHCCHPQGPAPTLQTDPVPEHPNPVPSIMTLSLSILPWMVHP